MIQKIPLISLPPPFSFFFPSFLSPFAFLFFCLQFFDFSFKNLNQDLPGGPGVKNPPANAGDPGSILGLGRLHMLWGNLSPCATTTGTHGESVLHKREATTVRSLCTALESSPLLPQVGKAQTQQ